MYSAYKLNKQETIYSLDILLFLFGTSLLFHVQFKLLLLDLHTNFLGGRSDGMVFSSLWPFSTVCCDPYRGFGIVNKAEVDVFLELSCFFDDPADVGNSISGSSAFSTTSLNIWKFMVHILLKPGLENFEHYFAGVWDECNYAVVWAFFGIAFLWDWNWLYWLCQSLWLRITVNFGKFWKRWEYHTTWPASWEMCMQVRKQQLELDMEQQTGSK